MNFMMGINAFFDTFIPVNYWYTDKTKELLNDDGNHPENLE
jgi:hypothetical protein